jgi:eukaryotic-like serine/threonine-protein kinase
MASQRIAGRYQMLRCIGRGGMGMVWLCHDLRLGRNVAVKQIGTLPGEKVPDLARAMREARSSAVLHHPHVVSIYDVVEEHDHIWLIMEYVPCRTLGQIIDGDGPMTPEAAVAIGAQVADGLAAAHAAGTIHRDVKPGNILVTEDGVAKISDFGIARARDHGQLTRSGVVIGTPEYFSPELARGEDPTPAADVWALGASLYAAVEGRPPYPHQSNPLALMATIASSWPRLPQNAGFLTGPISRMLDPDPRSRWSMSDAAHMLERLRERHARELTGQITSEIPNEREVAPAVAAPAALPPETAASSGGRAPADPDRRSAGPGGRSIGGRLLWAGLVGLLALAAVGGFLLLHDGSGGQPSATGHHRSHTGSSGGSPAKGHTPRSPGAGSTTGSSPTTGTTPTSSPTTGPSDGTPVGPAHSVTGRNARRFVRHYYAALPSHTRRTWSALSPRFQDKIGGYGNYEGFWSTISSVSVGRTEPAGNNAVDVSLTYTSSNGGVESEVRRIYLERGGNGYLIDDDAIVG